MTAKSTAASHVAGPWEASAEGVWAKSPWNARVRIASVTQFSPMNGINVEANARLLAAAPDLLAALDRVYADDEWHRLNVNTRDAVKAAIAKAVVTA